MRALLTTVMLLILGTSAATAQDLPPRESSTPPTVEEAQRPESSEPADDAPATDEETPGDQAKQDAPDPPPPVTGTGATSNLPGAPYRDRRNIKSLDVGFGVSGRSPIGWAGSATLYYLNLGAALTNHIIHLEAHTMFIPLLVDALLGIGMINANLAQSDDFPPFVQTFNNSASEGIYELANLRTGFHFDVSERRSWSYDFHTHALFFGAPIGTVPDFFIGFGAAVTHTWIDPLWDLSITGYGGPELGSDIAYFAGIDAVWRRALAKNFGVYLRWNAAGHYLTITQRFLPSGVVEAGFSFSNWK